MVTGGQRELLLFKVVISLCKCCQGGRIRQVAGQANPGSTSTSATTIAGDMQVPQRLLLRTKTAGKMSMNLAYSPEVALVDVWSSFTKRWRDFIVDQGPTAVSWG